MKTLGIAVICVTLGVVLTLRGGSAEILGAFFVGIFAGRTSEPWADLRRSRLQPRPCRARLAGSVSHRRRLVHGHLADSAAAKGDEGPTAGGVHDAGVTP
jgi:hypothetical protein